MGRILHVSFLESIYISLYSMALVISVLAGLALIIRLMAFALGAGGKEKR